VTTGDGVPEFELPSATLIAQRAAEVRERLAVAGGGRPVKLVAVTKAFPPELAARAIAAGLVDLGENYAQELVAKASELGGETGHRWHFIGGLQRNKVKTLAGLVSVWQTVDRDVLVDEIAKRAPGATVLVQVNTTDEPQKSGCQPEVASALVDRGRAGGLDVVGLMTVGPTDAEADPRPAFAALRELGEACEVAELSMGMSADYELAVAEGSTIVRIGSVLFGSRPPRT
jgi:pyridoxal phosphate enzyme (YggS family)